MEVENMPFWRYWDPFFEEMEIMRRRMNRLLRKLGEPIGEEEFGSFPLDISETDSEIIVRADLPGFEKEDISLRATENTLEISAQHKEEKKKTTERFYRAERKFGAVKRVFTLPVPINPEKATAEFRNGVLTVKLEKKEKKKIGKEIKIE